MSPLFRFTPGSKLPYAITDRDSNGHPVVADGVDVFTPEQAAERSGFTTKELIETWRYTFVALTDELLDETRPDLDASSLREEAMRRACRKLTDEQYADVLAQARELRYNLLSGECWVTTIEDEDTGEVRGVLCAKLEALQARVLASGFFNSRDPVEYRASGGPWTADWDDPLNPPYECRMTMYRKGVDRGWLVQGTWSQHARQTKFWREMPLFMLAKCVEAQGLRQLYRDVVGNVYIPDELPARPSARRKAEGPKPVEYATDAEVGFTREAVSTRAECIAAMRSMGLGADPSPLFDRLAQQAAAQGLDDTESPESFYAFVLAAARKLIPRRGGGR